MLLHQTELEDVKNLHYTKVLVCQIASTSQNLNA